MTFKIIDFNTLTTTMLYDILRLRQDVFILEQSCLYADIDDKDPLCYHVLGYSDDALVAYCRILPKNIAYKEHSIGRVVVSKYFRGIGAGEALMKATLEYIDDVIKAPSIRISAQAHLIDFYSKINFKQASNIYLEDGIPHIEMIRTLDM